MKKSFTKKTIKTNIDRLVTCFPHLGEDTWRFYKPADKIAEHYENLAFGYHPNWSYCIPLLPNYKLKDGTIVDIGIHLEDKWLLGRGNIHNCISANFVTSNEGQDYYSGQISPTSEMYKVALKIMRNLDMIDDAYILQRIANHNSFLEKFMQSDLTLWDMQEWIDDHMKIE
jgi:hypothetical protein